jgi:Holliday junction resolvase RusA-like endonuclease
MLPLRKKEFMEKVTFVIEVDPVPQGRPRFRRQGAHMVIYDPHEKEKKLFTNLCRNHAQGLYFDHSKHLWVTLTYYLPVARSHASSKRNAILWGFDEPHKPDIDNLVKFTMDCLTGLIWDDDSQVIHLNAKKMYSERPRTEISIVILEEFEISKEAKGILTLFSKEQLEELCHDFKKFEDEFRDFIANEGDFISDTSHHLQSLRLEAVAMNLSIFAEKYHKRLKQAFTKYPDYIADYIGVST